MAGVGFDCGRESHERLAQIHDGTGPTFAASIHSLPSCVKRHSVPRVSLRPSAHPSIVWCACAAPDHACIQYVRAGKEGTTEQRDHEETQTFQGLPPSARKSALTAKYYIGTSGSRTAFAHQMSSENLVSNHGVKVLMIGATQCNSGNRTERGVGMFRRVQNRHHSSLLIAYLNPQKGCNV